MVGWLIFIYSVRPDQYYTDVIARPMSGIGRKPAAGKEIEVARSSLIRNPAGGRIWLIAALRWSRIPSSRCSFSKITYEKEET